MTTIGEQQFQGRLLRELDRIATALEEQVMRDRQTDVDTDSIGALAIWREQVASKDTMLGFSDWVAWRSHDGQISEQQPLAAARARRSREGDDND